MTIHRKPGNQPDPGDMSGAIDADTAAAGAPPAHPDLQEAEEEEAAKLGDFA
jgi:hypothetical protein